MSQSLNASIGWSTASDAFQAGGEAARMARERLQPLGPQLALVFGSSWFDQAQLVRGVRAVVGGSALLGGSTAGEIVSSGPLTRSCAVLLLSSTTLTWGLGSGQGITADPRKAGQQAAFDAVKGLATTQRIGFLFFGDGLATSYAEVVRGVQEVLGTSSLIAGGLAGDELQFSRTYQYFHHQVFSDALVGVVFGGQGKMGVGIHHGFAPISKPRRISRAHANLLMELDGQPAASVYEEYFGAEVVARMRREGFTRQASAYPLGIQGAGQDQWLLRNVVSFEEDGSLACSAEMLEGGWLQLMIGSREFALEAARRAAQDALKPLDRVAAVIVFDSVSRRKLLGQQQGAEEIAVLRQVVGPATPLIGCYTYGEQAPLGSASLVGRTVVQTGSILVIALGTSSWTS
jgi:hypothetical protein